MRLGLGGRWSRPAVAHLACSTSTSAVSGGVYRSPLRTELFFDTICPHSWLAFEVLSRYRRKWNLDLLLRPVVSADVLADSGNNFLQSLTGSNKKAKYFFEDLERLGRHLRVPIRLPESPFYLLGVAGSRRQQSFVAATAKLRPDAMEGLCRGLWYRAWCEDLDVGRDSSMLTVATAVGMTQEEAEACLEVRLACQHARTYVTNSLQLAVSADTAEELRVSADEALGSGAFCTPWIVFHARGGLDRKHLLAGVRDLPILAETLGRSMYLTTEAIIEFVLELEWVGPVPEDADDGQRMPGEPERVTSHSDVFLEQDRFAPLVDMVNEADDEQRAKQRAEERARRSDQHERDR